MKPKKWDKISENYHDIIISPFQKGVKNPLFNKIERIGGTKDKTVMDAGCGTGELLGVLSSKFKKVYAIDFSSKMIEKAKESNKEDNIEFSIEDLRNLSKFENTCDVIISVNSILGPKVKDTNLALRSIYTTLKENGIFFGIFPSMESIIYHGFLIFEKNLEIEKDEEKALTKAKKIMERNKYDLIKGTYTDDDGEQKFYYRFELKLRMKETGFRDIKISKVLYPWGKATGDFDDFPGKPKMWDWFVTAYK